MQRSLLFLLPRLSLLAIRRCSFAMLSVSLLLLAQPASARVTPAVGLDYWSDYFWRGFSFYGDASSPRGVFFPWIGASWKQLSFSVVGELPQSMLGGDPNITEEAWGGIDFILGGYETFFDARDFHPLDGLILQTGASFAYFWYPSSEYWNSPSVGGNGDDYRGISDIVGSVGITTDIWATFTPNLGLHVAYVPDQDFNLVWGRTQKVHVWVTAGVSYAWTFDSW